jgi:hypothetical protein
MRIVIVLIVLAVAFILAVMCANVVFVAKCSSIGSRIASDSFPLVDDSLGTEVAVFQVTNSFSRGEILVSAANSTPGSVGIEFYGSDVSANAPSGYQLSNNSRAAYFICRAHRRVLASPPPACTARRQRTRRSKSQSGREIRRNSCGSTDRVRCVAVQFFFACSVLTRPWNSGR